MTLARLKAFLAEIDDYEHADQLLEWDSRVVMPPAGAEARAQVSATLARLRHERFTSDKVGELLDEASADGDDVAAALIRVTKREWERATRVPTELAGEMAHAGGVAVAAWDRAKAASDFASFRPHLDRQLELKRRYVTCFPDASDPYDALLDQYDEGITTTQIAEVFARLKDELVELVRQRKEVADHPLRGPFPYGAQYEAGYRVLEAFGFDRATWRLDETLHPFAAAPGAGDVRLTTHTVEDDLTSLFGTMHEFGHGVYEVDIDPALARTPLGRGTSSTIHESQSRTWENLVGRSRGFWRWFYPQLRELLSKALRGVDEDVFVRAVNAVRPGPIRGEADEVTYGLHIILRFELEQELLRGDLAVRDLPEAWNVRTQEYLGVDVPDDAHGVLQDMHWAIGHFGYFPTYQLGNVLSVQIWERAQAELGDLEEQFARGEFTPLRAWLREHVYRHGSIYPPRELLRRVIGTELDPDPYLRYLRAKFA
jgi:carboxypeptidase Taq